MKLGSLHSPRPLTEPPSFMARGLFITGFTISEVLAIQQRAKGFLIEGKTLMTWNEAGSSATKQFTIILSY